MLLGMYLSGVALLLLVAGVRGRRSIGANVVVANTGICLDAEWLLTSPQRYTQDIFLP